MRIAINTRFLLPHKIEGFGRFTYEVTRRLVENNPQHTFFFFFDRAFDSKYIFGDNVVPIVLRPPARHPVLFKIWFNKSVTNALKRHKIDVFFSPDGYLSMRTKIPQVGVIHDLNFVHFPQDIPASPRRYLLTFFPKFAEKAWHLFTVSEFSKQDIIQQYGIEEEKISVVYNSANEIFKSQPESIKLSVRQKFTDGEPYFVYVGAIHPRKNVGRLVAAFKAFKAKTESTTKLLVVGASLWKTVDQDLFHRDIVFTGHIEIEELARIVGSARALCLVSYFEGFGIPLVEAMRSHVPVLAGNLTALPEVCGEAGLLVDPFNVDMISDGLISLDADEALRADLIHKGKIQCAKFSWDETAKKIEDVLLSAI